MPIHYNFSFVPLNPNYFYFRTTSTSLSKPHCCVGSHGISSSLEASPVLQVRTFTCHRSVILSYGNPISIISIQVLYPPGSIYIKDPQLRLNQPWNALVKTTFPKSFIDNGNFQIRRSCEKSLMHSNFRENWNQQKDASLGPFVSTVSLLFYVAHCRLRAPTHLVSYLDVVTCIRTDTVLLRKPDYSALI